MSLNDYITVKTSDVDRDNTFTCNIVKIITHHCKDFCAWTKTTLNAMTKIMTNYFRFLKSFWDQHIHIFYMQWCHEYFMFANNNNTWLFHGEQKFSPPRETINSTNCALVVECGQVYLRLHFVPITVVFVTNLFHLQKNMFAKEN